MAVQTRRGAYENFDPSKLLAGEWATVLSGDPNGGQYHPGHGRSREQLHV